jgi:hypothetical protein
MSGMRIGSVVFNGRSGEKYCFEVWPVETRFKPAAAVYFVTKRELTAGVFSRAGHEHLYLGQTSDLSGPLGTAAQLAWFDKQGANCVCIYSAESEARRAAIQRDLKEAYPTTHPEQSRGMFPKDAGWL